MPALTAYEIAQLIIQIGWPAAVELINTIQGDDPDWQALRAKVATPFATHAGPRPNP